MGVEISAIICTRNRASFLEKCLKSLLQQSLPQDRYEVIVVDNGSTDCTKDVLSRYAHIPLLKMIDEPIPGLSRARNRGLEEAQAPFVGYIDDDAVAGERWLEAALEAFSTSIPQPDWVGGPVTLEWEVEKPEWINEELSVPLGWVNWGDFPRTLTKEEWLIGANSCFKKKTLEECGGFDQRLGRQGACLLSGEETQIKKKIEASGGLLYYHPDVTVRHYVPAARVVPSWFYRRYFWGGVTDCFMQKTLVADAELATTTLKQPDAEFVARVTRVLRNFWKSFGIAVTAEKKIQARIYVSYVFGWFYGVVRWRNMKVMARQL